MRKEFEMMATSGHMSEDEIEINMILVISINLFQSISSILSVYKIAISCKYSFTTFDYTTHFYVQY